MHLSKKMKVTIAAIALSFAAAGTYAYWTGSGSGSGTEAVGTSGSVTLTATVPDGIHPGTSEVVTFKAANATDSGIQVTTVKLASVTVDAPHSTCVVADFSMADVTEGDEVAAGATAQTLSHTGTLVYADTGVSQDTCKGATLTLHLTSV